MRDRLRPLQAVYPAWWAGARCLNLNVAVSARSRLRRRFNPALVAVSPLLLRQVLAVHFFHTLAADGRDHIAETGPKIRRRRAQHAEVAFVVETWTQRNLAARRCGKDHDLLREIDLRDLVADLPCLPQFLECLGVRDDRWACT